MKPNYYFQIPSVQLTPVFRESTISGRLGLLFRPGEEGRVWKGLSLVYTLRLSHP